MSRSGKAGIAVLALATVLCLLPLLSVILAGSTAALLGCQLDEGSVHPCIAFGTDIGELLCAMGVMGWFMLLTMPVLALLVLVWLALGIGLLARRFLRRA